MFIQLLQKYIASTKIVKVIDNELHKQTLP